MFLFNIDPQVTTEESSIILPAEDEPKMNGETVTEEPKERKRITKSISLTQEEMENDKGKSSLS